LQQQNKHVGFTSLSLKYGLQQPREWSPRFLVHKLQSYPKLSQTIFHTWTITLQRIYDQKQLITIGITNISDISTVPYIRDHEKNVLQTHLKDIFDWTVLSLSQRLFSYSQLWYLKFKYRKDFSIYKVHDWHHWRARVSKAKKAFILVYLTSNQTLLFHSYSKLSRKIWSIFLWVYWV
jgi:hypothetical protein